jgi:hypothetical protein
MGGSPFPTWPPKDGPSKEQWLSACKSRLAGTSLTPQQVEEVMAILKLAIA